MIFWIKFTIFWTLGYVVAYTFMRPEVLARRRGHHEGPWLLQMGMPWWTEDSSKHAREHYKAYVPVGIALWLVLFLMAVHLKDTIG